MSIKRKIATWGGEVFGRSIMQRASDVTEELELWTSKNPFNAKNANPEDEDEYMKNYEKMKYPVPTRKPEYKTLVPMQRNVSSWSDEDLNQVMSSEDYRYDRPTQEKVQSYFQYMYPGMQKYDATGRPIPPQKRKTGIL